MARRAPIMIRNVHREPLGQHIDYGELTDECVEALKPPVITDEEGLGIIWDATHPTNESEDNNGN